MKAYQRTPFSTLSLPPNLSASDFTGLEKILAGGGLVKGALPKPSDLFTNALLPKA